RNRKPLMWTLISPRESAFAPENSGNAAGGLTSIALGQQQLATVLDRNLSHLGEALQQPRQHDLEPDVIVGHVKMTCSDLPERANAKIHAIVFPAFLVDLEHGNAGGGTRQSGLEATRCFLTAKAMRNGNDERRGHLTSPRFDLTACKLTSFEKKRRPNHRNAKNGTFDIPASFLSRWHGWTPSRTG